MVTTTIYTVSSLPSRVLPHVRKILFSGVHDSKPFKEMAIVCLLPFRRSLIFKETAKHGKIQGFAKTAGACLQRRLCAKLDVDNKMHGPDEFAEIDQLLISGMLFTTAIADLCK